MDDRPPCTLPSLRRQCGPLRCCAPTFHWTSLGSVNTGRCPEQVERPLCLSCLDHSDTEAVPNCTWLGGPSLAFLGISGHTRTKASEQLAFAVVDTVGSWKLSAEVTPPSWSKQQGQALRARLLHLTLSRDGLGKEILREKNAPSAAGTK